MCEAACVNMRILDGRYSQAIYSSSNHSVVKDCSYSIASVMEFPESYAKPSVFDMSGFFVRWMRMNKWWVHDVNHSCCNVSVSSVGEPRIFIVNGVNAMAAEAQLRWGSSGKLYILAHCGLKDKMAAIWPGHFQTHFWNTTCHSLIQFSLKFVSWGPIDNESALVQVMVWHRAGNKLLPQLTSLFTPVCDAIRHMASLGHNHLKLTSSTLWQFA